MFDREFWNGIFEVPVLAGSQLLVISLVLLALFLYVVFWPKIRADMNDREIEDVRRIAQVLLKNRDRLMERPGYVRWALRRISDCTRRCKVHVQYLGISELDIALISYELEHGRPKTMRPPPSFVREDGEIVMRLDENTDVFDLEELPAPTPKPEPKRSIPPPFQGARTVQPPPLEAELHEETEVDDASPQDVTAGGNAKARRRARRAAARAADNGGKTGEAKG